MDTKDQVTMRCDEEFGLHVKVECHEGVYLQYSKMLSFGSHLAIRLEYYLSVKKILLSSKKKLLMSSVLCKLKLGIPRLSHQSHNKELTSAEKHAEAI